MSLAEAIQRSTDLRNRIDEAMSGLQIPASDRTRLSAALLDQVCEHHESIRLLIEKCLTGSAFALLRGAFEQTVRGIWLFRCASEYQIRQFQRDKLDVKFGLMISAVEAKLDTRCGQLDHIKRAYWKSMCSYAHGGYLQAVRRISPLNIGPNYSEVEQIELLSFADFCLVLACVSSCSLGERSDVAERITQLLPAQLEIG